MKTRLRIIIDRIFTVLSSMSIVLITAALLIVLGPMIIRGGSAVIFKATVEFRKMQMAEFSRGKSDVIEKEIEKTNRQRQFVYDTINKFKRGIEPEALIEEVRQINRQFGQELRDKNISGDEYLENRELARELRDKLEQSFQSNDKNLIDKNVRYVLEFKDDIRFKSSVFSAIFPIAEEFHRAIEKIDLQRRQQYAESLKQVEEILFHSEQKPGLFGPRPGEDLPQTIMLRYGATRWDQAQELLDELLYPVRWVQKEAGKPLVAEKYSRREEFSGTLLEPLFENVQKEITSMMKPKRTFYWQFFKDDSINSHYFGGVGPEIIGTVLLTIIAMIFVVPLGVISAAYLVECSSQDNFIIRIIRMCINTLAGVPSIVFGLFGLAFFVLYFLPLFGTPSEGNIMAASMTLAILTLPLMIRSSEEAIRAVPQTYKEASLALGAGSFITFVKVTLPAALPGILTGIILSLSRVAGETAPILFTGAVAFGRMPSGRDFLFQGTRTLSYGSYDMAVGDKIAKMVPHQQFGMVVTLILLVLILNAAAIYLRSRILKKLHGN